MARTYAKLVTPHGEYDMSHAELDQLRMLIDMSLETDTIPRADPPILPGRYEDLSEFIMESFDGHRENREYLD